MAHLSARAPLLPMARRPIAHDSLARLHVGTRAVTCRIVLSDRAELRPGEQALAQLRLDAPLSLVQGDRFVLRDPTESISIGGGMVLDPTALRSGFHGAARQRFLHALASAGPDPAAWLRAVVEHHRFVHRLTLDARSPFAEDVLDGASGRLEAQGTIVVRDHLVVAGGFWRALLESARRQIREHHQRHPAQNGFPVSQLRRALRIPPCWPDLGEVLIVELVQGGFEVVGAAIRERGFRPSLPDQLEPVAHRLYASLSRAGLNPPGRKEVATTAALREALEFLIKTGRVVALGTDVILADDAFSRAHQIVQQHLSTHGAGTVSVLKQAVGTSRRVMVPLLEKLDHDGLTIRDGEVRQLRASLPSGAQTAPGHQHPTTAPAGL